VVSQDIHQSHKRNEWSLHLRRSDQDLEAYQSETSLSRLGLFCRCVASVEGLVMEGVGLRRLPVLDFVEL
jgi:hypothetical protein